MRVKVGNRWFSVTSGRPIAVELTLKDRENIANMHPDATRYAVIADTDPSTSEERMAWLAEG